MSWYLHSEVVNQMENRDLEKILEIFYESQLE